MTSPARVSLSEAYIHQLGEPGLADFDNDGYPDISCGSNGTVYPELERVRSEIPGPKIRRLLYRNQGGNGTFVHMHRREGLVPISSSPFISRGCAFGDFDNDGDIDVLNHEPERTARPCCATTHPPGITGSRFASKGTKSNRSAQFGGLAPVLIRYDGKIQAQCVTSQFQLSLSQ